MSDRLRKIGPLDVVEIKGSNRGPCIVLFHGFGADCYDLTPLSQAVKAPSGSSWYFPNGTVQVPVGPGFTGRAWFHIDIQALERAMAMGRHRDMSKTVPPGLEKAKMMAHEFLGSLGRPPEDIVIGGFSQGAMLATDIALSSQSNYRALVILSGTLIKEEDWRTLAPLHKGMPFFQSHGDTDAILDPAAAEKLEILLREAGLVGHLEIFRGGHEIPNTVLKHLSQFLMNVAS